MNLIKTIEKGLLGVIALLTIVATIQEIMSIYMVGRVNLPDLLLLFIYTEVLGMIGVFYVSNKIPITLPLFIAMTALSRLIILQGKDMEPSTLIYEAGAILLIAIACLIIRYRPPNQSKELWLYQSVTFMSIDYFKKIAFVINEKVYFFNYFNFYYK